MIDSAPSVILTCEGFAGRVQLTRYAEQKAARLLRQAHPHPHRICVHVRLDPDSRQPSFIACATIERDAVIHVAHASGEDPQPAVSSALARLERDLLGGPEMRRGSARRREPITDFLKI